MQDIQLRYVAIILMTCWAGITHAQNTLPAKVAVTIDAGKTYQEIQNFGASDAWSCQFAGQWPLGKRNAMADLLFSTDTLADGRPKGIGLSLWRFNIGAGSAEKEGNDIPEWTSTESFLQKDGSYDWSKQAGQVWFLEAAKKRGVKQFLAFINSPHVQFTTNGKGYATAGKCNILPEKYDASALYLANVLASLKEHAGINFDYISPVNEPQWDWSDNHQEGCPYNNEQIYGVVKSLSHALTTQHLSTRILLTESGKMDYLYSKSDKPDKGEQVNVFFNPASALYVGGLPNVSRTIASHSYFTTSPYDTGVAIRNRLGVTVSKLPGLKFWQSEYCILGDNAGEINGHKRDLGITSGLYVARVIHYDLAVANASAWQWWLAVSSADYKDGLVYIDKNRSDGQFYESKMLWAMGNYSRFIRPGSKRIAVMLADSSLQKNLLISAYINNKHALITVVVNDSDHPVALALTLKNITVDKLRTYTTAEGENLQPGAAFISTHNTINIPARAVVTLTGKAQ